MGRLGDIGRLPLSNLRSEGDRAQLLKQFHVVEREPRLAELSILEMVESNA